MKKSLLLLALLASFNANANLVVNGGFEAQSNAPTTFTRFTNLTPLTGWVAGSGASDPYVETRNSLAGTASEGNNFAELDVSDPGDATYNGSAQGIISQSINLTAGLYDFSFDYSARPGTIDSGNGLEFYWNGNLVTTVLAPTNETGNNVWLTLSTTLTAGNGFNTLLFKEIGTIDGFGTSLDNVQLNVAAVPEPETYGMMLAGLAMLGFASRRRKA